MHQHMYTQIQQRQYEIWFGDSLSKQYMITYTYNAKYLCNIYQFCSTNLQILDSIWVVKATTYHTKFSKKKFLLL